MCDESSDIASLRRQPSSTNTNSPISFLLPHVINTCCREYQKMNSKENQSNKTESSHISETHFSDLLHSFQVVALKGLLGQQRGCQLPRFFSHCDLSQSGRPVLRRRLGHQFSKVTISYSQAIRQYLAVQSLRHFPDIVGTTWQALDWEVRGLVRNLIPSLIQRLPRENG